MTMNDRAAYTGTGTNRASGPGGAGTTKEIEASLCVAIAGKVGNINDVAESLIKRLTELADRALGQEPGIQHDENACDQPGALGRILSDLSVLDCRMSRLHEIAARLARIA